MGTFARLADLPLTIDACRLEGLTRRVSPDFERHTTLVWLAGGGARGCGEDVTYDVEDQRAFQRAGSDPGLAGRWTLAELSRRLDSLELFPKRPSQPGFRDYRRWAFESAALDLALAQAGRPLDEALGMRSSPVRFVVSLGLGDPPDTGLLEGWRRLYPGLRFKLDAGAAWDDALIERLAALGGIDVVDLKGAYRGTPVDLEPDPELYARVARGLPEAWIEDPALTPATERVLAEHRPRITWDAPIHSTQDILGLPFEPRTLNFKPSRFGKLETLLDAYDHCREQGIALYGGGQWELGVGRGQIQLLAALFHPDAPNDVAPRGFSARQPTPGLPESPLEPRPAPRGFQREDR